MPPEPEGRRFFRLFEAIQNFCDPVLVTALMKTECRISESEHRNTNRPLLSDVATFRAGSRRDWRDEPSGLPDFHDAWDRLIENFKGLIELEVLELDAVQIAPTATTERRALPNAWAGMMSFDFRENTIFTSYGRYGAIRVSRASETRGDAPPSTAFPPLPPFARDDKGRIVLSPDDVGLLSDGTLLALFEEHGRRVVGTQDSKLVMPGKVSFLPIIRRKLIARAEQDELLGKMAEFQWLADWIASKIEHHQIPTATTIAKVLAKDYELAKARSSAAIRKLNP